MVIKIMEYFDRDSIIRRSVVFPLSGFTKVIFTDCLDSDREGSVLFQLRPIHRLYLFNLLAILSTSVGLKHKRSPDGKG
jgi:hypothetical protein